MHICRNASSDEQRHSSEEKVTSKKETNEYSLIIVGFYCYLVVNCQSSDAGGDLRGNFIFTAAGKTTPLLSRD